MDPAVADVIAAATGLPHHTRLMEAALDRDATAARALLVEHIGFTLAAYEASVGGV